jgi:hypothetical protein
MAQLLLELARSHLREFKRRTIDRPSICMGQVT